MGKLTRQRKFAKVFRASPDAFLISRLADGRLIEVNEAFARISGYEREEIIGRTSADLRLWADPEDRAVLVQRLREQKAVSNLEIRFRTKSGELRYGLLSAETADLGGEQCILGIVRDVSERKQAEEALRASEERYRDLYENANDILYTIDLQGNLTSLNKAGELVLGYTRGEAMGRNINEIVSPESQELFRRMLELKLAGVSRTTTYELEILARGGRKVILEISSRLIYRDGKPVGVQGVARDITERKAAERAVRLLSGRILQAQDEERRHIARELHDSTAQNLAALITNLKLMSRAARSLDEKTRKALAESLSLAEQSGREIRTLSYLLHPPLLDELGLASALRAFVEGFAQRTGIQVALDVQPDFGRLSQELETTLFRIAQESLNNIHRHSESPTAEIQISRDSAQVTLEVRDEGRGMLVAALEELEGQIAQLGVGIAGMRERVGQLGGRLEIYSRGRGTTVKVTLPLPGGGS